VGPVLYLIACGGPPAGQLPEFVGFAQAGGWDVCVIATPDGTKFMDVPYLAELTGHPVRVHYKDPDDPDVLPPPDAFLIAPATFNMVNKLANGISDTLALGLVNEAVGLGLPITAAPWPNAALARHPAFRRSVADLRDWGITVILDPTRLPDASDEPAVFPWAEIRSDLTRLRAATTPGRRALPGPGGGSVAVQDLGAAGVPGGGGAVRIQDQGPSHPVDHDLVVIEAEQNTGSNAGLAAVGLVPDMMHLAGRGGLVASAGPLAAPLGPQDHRVADPGGDVLGIPDVQRQGRPGQPGAQLPGPQERGQPARP
jgi:hypothetical protein